jgi:hypothetical protein
MIILILGIERIKVHNRNQMNQSSDNVLESGYEEPGRGAEVLIDWRQKTKKEKGENQIEC